MMEVVLQEPGQYGGQVFEEVGGHEEDHLGIHHDTQLVVSVGQVYHDRFSQWWHQFQLFGSQLGGTRMSW